MYVYRNVNPVRVLYEKSRNFLRILRWRVLDAGPVVRKKQNRYFEGK